MEIQFAQRATSGTNERFWKGDAFVSSLSIDAGVEENTTYSTSHCINKRPWAVH